MCDPLSIQDQSVRGSNYCKFLCVLSSEREREREEGQGAAVAAGFPPIHRFCRSLITDFYFKLMKTFLSTATFQLSRAHLATSLPTRLACAADCCPAISSGLEETAKRWSRGGSQKRHGRVPGAERASGALGAPCAWCRHGGRSGGL